MSASLKWHYTRPKSSALAIHSGFFQHFGTIGEFTIGAIVAIGDQRTLNSFGSQSLVPLVKPMTTTVPLVEPMAPVVTLVKNIGQWTIKKTAYCWHMLVCCVCHQKVVIFLICLHHYGRGSVYDSFVWNLAFTTPSWMTLRCHLEWRPFPRVGNFVCRIGSQWSAILVPLASRVVPVVDPWTSFVEHHRSDKLFQVKTVLSCLAPSEKMQLIGHAKHMTSVMGDR